ncbi:MAG: ABC transporter ATP-binding protein [Deltaproteobacteria bacterium]|nr:ABC transporter ATP-binding protein [Deltaproteobacteria bacterium]
MLQLTDVKKVFRGRNGNPVVAIDNVSLRIDPGEFIVINGPSGSGKSSLLFTMGGMQPPTTGNVTYDHMDMYAVSPSKRSVMRNKRMGFVFQTFNLISYLNSLENVAFPALLAGISRKDAFKRAEMLLGRLGLDERLFHRPMELSVGERQRVAICRSLVNAPDILLADEPTGNMDPELTLETMRIFRDINQQGHAIVMVTHDPELSKVGSRHIVIENGLISGDRMIEEEMVL